MYELNAEMAQHYDKTSIRNNKQYSRDFMYNTGRSATKMPQCDKDVAV